MDFLDIVIIDVMDSFQSVETTSKKMESSVMMETQTTMTDVVISVHLKQFLVVE
jgi:hypothetical protein